MPQGKTKKKPQLPEGVKKKANVSKKSEKVLHQVRKGAPVKPKIKSMGKQAFKNVEKMIRHNIEEEVRAKAGDKEKQK